MYAKRLAILGLGMVVLLGGCVHSRVVRHTDGRRHRFRKEQTHRVEERWASKDRIEVEHRRRKTQIHRGTKTHGREEKGKAGRGKQTEGTKRGTKGHKRKVEKKIVNREGTNGQRIRRKVQGPEALSREERDKTGKGEGTKQAKKSTKARKHGGRRAQSGEEKGKEEKAKGQHRQGKLQRHKTGQQKKRKDVDAGSGEGIAKPKARNDQRGALELRRGR